MGLFQHNDSKPLCYPNCTIVVRFFTEKDPEKSRRLYHRATRDYVPFFNTNKEILSKRGGVYVRIWSTLPPLHKHGAKLTSLRKMVFFIIIFS